ncbi:MAG: GNAT family protein [Halofilum sp. (in: g-proteobacteria)]|nr:GNAT family protein [Halofilum sp. (in: g-proteobacteria)]
MTTDLPAGAPLPDDGPAARPGSESRTGESVTLRPLDPTTDAGALYAASHGDAVTETLWTYMPYGPFADAAAMRAWLDDCAASDDPVYRAVLDNEGRPCGMVSYLNIVPEHRRLELGHIWYGPAVQRTRINTETIYLMLRESFDRLGCRRVEWKCDALNARSRAAALRLGLRLEGIFRHHMIVKGRNRDTAWFALVDADWPAVKANLERWLYGGENGLSLTELNAPLVAGFHDPAAGKNHG